MFQALEPAELAEFLAGVEPLFVLRRITGLDSPRELRSSVSRGSDSPPDCHSLPLPFEPLPSNKKTTTMNRGCLFIGADYGARTRHLHLGKVALYQMS